MARGYRSDIHGRVAVLNPVRRKDTLISDLAEKLGSTAVESRRWYECFLELAKERLLDGDEVILTGVGLLYTENPKRGSRDLKFRPSQKFKKALQAFPIEEDLDEMRCVRQRSTS